MSLIVDFINVAVYLSIYSGTMSSDSTYAKSFIKLPLGEGDEGSL